MADWHDLLPRAELEPGDVTFVTQGKLKLAVYDTADGIYISDALCTHAAANLCDGYLDGFVIECPLHQGCFDIRDGTALDAPVTRALKVYPARTRNEIVQIQLQQAKNGDKNS